MPTPATTKALTGLTSGTAYEYRVTAIGDGTTYLDSDPSAVSTFTTLIPLAVPTGLTLTKTSTTVTATWSAVTNATGYVVAWVSGNGTWTEETVSGTTFTKSGCAQGTVYEFKVKAISSNTAYQASDFCTAVSTTTLIKLATPAPTITKDTDSLTVSWAAIANATGYNVSWKKGTGQYTEVAVTGTSFVKSDLAEGDTYTFKVQATSTNAAYEESEYSAEVTDSTQVTLGTPVPTIAKTTSSLVVTWPAITNADGYTVAYKTGTGAYTEAQVATNRYEATGLAEGVTMTFKVKATSTNAAYANSPFSTEVSDTTQITLDTPTNVQVSNITENSVTITWQSVDNASGYRIEYRRNGDTQWTSADVN